MELKTVISLGVLENVTEEEMQLAIKAIETDRKEKVRKAEIAELQKILMDTINRIYELNGSVRLTIGGKYLPVDATLHSTSLNVRTW